MLAICAADSEERVSWAYLGGGHSPDLVVVRAHEDIGDTSTHHADDPLVEVLGLGVGDTSLHGSIDHAINALDLLLLGQHRDVVLEGVGNPFSLAANVGDTLVAEPVIVVGEGLVDAVIEVFVVGEDNVTTDIVELWAAGLATFFRFRCLQGSTYETFGSHIGGSQTTGSLVAVNDQPRGAVLYPKS